LPRFNFNFSPLSVESSSMFRQTACVVDWAALILSCTLPFPACLISFKTPHICQEWRSEINSFWDRCEAMFSLILNNRLINLHAAFFISC
jgi:hypothetical protein